MTIVKSCWSPFVWSDNISTGTKAIAFYTVAISVIYITLLIYQLNGGDSSQLYNPIFETDVRTSMQTVGQFLIYYFLFLIVASFLMVYGLRRGVRGWLIPWLSAWIIICLFQLIYGLWMLYGYYIYLESVMIALCNWLWMGYNFYCWLVVLSMYKLLEELQSPNIELLWP